MHEILRALPAGALILDLGSRTGSFETEGLAATTVRVDLDPPAAAKSACLVCADAAQLPFRDASFDCIVSNHSLEHFQNLEAALAEIGRIVKPRAALYVAVPDATTFSDRVYRWLGKGGGHVNAFDSPEWLERKLEQASGLPHVATQTLVTSLSFLNRRNIPGRPQRKLALFFWGREGPLVVLSRLLLFADRRLGWRSSVYGWAMYFGVAPKPQGAPVWSNVCVRCGAGHPSAGLLASGKVRRRWMCRLWDCPSCGAVNLFTPDEDYARLR